MRAFETAMQWLKMAIGLVLLGGVVLNFVNVIMRYIFGSPYPWTEEAMVFGLVAMVLAGTVVATAFDHNLKIDIVQQLFPGFLQRILRIFSHAVWIGVALFLAVQSYTVVTLMMNLGQTSLVLRVPTWIPHSFLLTCFILSACAAVYAIVREFTSPQEEHHAPIPETALAADEEPDGHRHGL